jgi:hypothetical protein
MTKVKHFLVLVVFFIITVLISAYGFGSCSPLAAELVPQEIVTQAYQQFLVLQNYHMTSEATISLAFQGQDVNVIMKSESDTQIKPMLFKNVMDITVDCAAKKNEQRIVQYVAETGDKFLVYSNINNQWLKQSMPYYNRLNEYNNYFKAIKSVTLISDFDDTAIYEVVIDASYLQENIEHLMASPGMQEIMLPKNIMKDVGDFKYVITLDKKASTISKITMDLSGLLSTIGNNMSASTEVPEKYKMVIGELFKNMKMVMSVNFSQQNEAQEIIIPQEALDAPLQKSPSLPPV